MWQKGNVLERTVDKGYTVTPSAQSQTLQFFFFLNHIVQCHPGRSGCRGSEVQESVTCGYNGHDGIICLIVD